MVFYIKREGNSLQGQWLGLRTFTAKGPNSIASLKTKTQKQSSMDRKKKKKKGKFGDTRHQGCMDIKEQEDTRIHLFVNQGKRSLEIPHCQHHDPGDF